MSALYCHKGLGVSKDGGGGGQGGLGGRNKDRQNIKGSPIRGTPTLFVGGGALNTNYRLASLKLGISK